MSKRLRRRLHEVLLGPSSTFRNRHRDWLYLGFLLGIGAMIAVTALRGG